MKVITKMIVAATVALGLSGGALAQPKQQYGEGTSVTLPTKKVHKHVKHHAHHGHKHHARQSAKTRASVQAEAVRANQAGKIPAGEK